MAHREDYGPDGSGVFAEFSERAWDALTSEMLRTGDNPLEEVNRILEDAGEEAAEAADSGSDDDDEEGD